MTRYLQWSFKLSRNPLESVNKFPEVLVYRKTPEDNNQGLLREKLWRLKLIQVWKQITYETSDTSNHHQWLCSNMYFSHSYLTYFIIRFSLKSMQNASCWILWEKVGDVSNKATIYKGRHAILCTVNDLKDFNYFHDLSSKISSD